MKINVQRQAGATLIEMMLVIGIIAFMTVLSFSQKQLEMDQRRAKQVGSQLFMYNNAVRNWISVNTGTTPLDVTYSGAGWLKPTSCGGTSIRPEGFLNCNFIDGSVVSPMPFSNMVLSTRIVRTYTPGEGVKITGTTTTTPFSIPGRSGNSIRADLSGLAALTAASGSMGMDDPTPATSDASFKSDPITGVIVMVASNRADKDAWLRTDGSNTMNNNLVFMDTIAQQIRQIMNVGRVQAKDGEVLYIGNKNNLTSMPANGGGQAALTTEGVVVDEDLRIYGSLVTNKGITALTGNIVSKTGNVEAGANVIAGEDMYAKRYYDSDNTTLYADPSGKSMLNMIATNSVESLTAATALDVKTNTLNFQPQTAGLPTKFNGNVDVDTFKVKRNGKYVSLANLLPNFVFKEGWIAFNGSLIPKPSCGPDGGTPRIIVTPQLIPTNTSPPPPGGYSSRGNIGDSRFYAENSGSNWKINANAWHYNGSNHVRATVIAHTYCLY